MSACAARSRSRAGCLLRLRRTSRIALVLVVPCVLMALIKGMFENQPGTFE